MLFLSLLLNGLILADCAGNTSFILTLRPCPAPCALSILTLRPAPCSFFIGSPWRWAGTQKAQAR